jgi:hypothetical protein
LYLIDTNVWLGRVLDQARSEEVGQFIDYIPSDKLFVADFAYGKFFLCFCYERVLLLEELCNGRGEFIYVRLGKSPPDNRVFISSSIPISLAHFSI